MDKKLNVVSACFEAMLAQAFHVYAGGLGVVQAGLLKSAGRKEWPVNLYGLGILWRQGYYDQQIATEGMTVNYPSHRYPFLEDTGVRVQVVINGKLNTIKVWRLPPEVFKTVPAYFLDTDLEENDELARSITRNLYGGTEETRLAQEIVLGIGGVRAFEALGIKINLWHGQEGHTVLMAMELLRKNLEKGMPLERALKKTRKRFVFTTHTPEIAGNEEHDIGLMQRMGCFPGISREIAAAIGGESFNMTVAALRLSRKANAVSKLHLQTTEKMWDHVSGRCPIVSFTNGVDADWQRPACAKASTPEELESAHDKGKVQLLGYTNKRTGASFKPKVLTITWARRFADYKRPWLAFLDWPWLERLLWTDKLQLIVAGKPHPNDLRAISIFNDVLRKSSKVPNLKVLAGYERYQSQLLKAGSDIWLFTSRRPREACSTSGMAAALNGTLNLASRDGWYDEFPDEHYFPFGVSYPRRTEGEQDTADYLDFQKVLEQAVEMYYNDKTAWWAKALGAKRFVEEHFSSDRMLADYIDLMYCEKEIERGASLFLLCLPRAASKGYNTMTCSF